MFTTILISVLIISLIAAALAAVLAVSENYLGDYGPCKITINKESELEVRGGKSLLALLSQEKIFIPSACGGRGTCGMCKLKVLEGGGPLLPTEEPFLSDEERDSNVRLSCQVKVRNDIEIQIPDEIFAVQEFKCRCADILELTHDIRQFTFELIEPEKIDFVPGQYVQLFTPAYEKSSEEVYRAYSISSDARNDGKIELIIRLVPNGICTTYCFDYLKEGDEVKLNGPYGDFQLSDTEAPIIFIAGGSGMAPIKSMLHQMVNTDNKRKASYFFGANKVSELFLGDLMKDFESQLADFTYVPVVANPEPEENWDGETGLVTEAVKRQIDDASVCEAYLCGSPGMIDASIAVLKELGMKEENIFYDKFA
ncbi:Na(+)-translocating NADH-quinone reductase subunit F [Limihaloglobus sulfuriphilus]|uniref:Na(+)-translocating NADH-quinone reductase subunit F n=1 Tax=Limihaloglobus sulfuriphilus TaxID=1851148 RepID=A0A1Q2MB97_9BACT|nr:2Fe-2S iron-sulfur cluster binding domain-containing protein [Limihaloglobus sulfuriphilus]AQQ69939.1 Na(+)-translocating NADH-quinone reductase subunit F [Limihaloglobus sulfuriphilus]